MVAWRRVIGSKCWALTAAGASLVLSGSCATEPASDVSVTVRRPGCAMCAGGVPSFVNPDGSSVEARDRGSIEGGRLWSAAVLAGGSVGGTFTVSSSPSSSTSDHWTVKGVEPGDRLTMFGSGSELPADCVRRSVELIPDDFGSHWEDPDAGSVDARVIVVSQYSAMPFGSNGSSTTVDGETATTIRSRNLQVPPTTVTVDVISCSETDYAALRPLL